MSSESETKALTEGPEATNSPATDTPVEEENRNNQPIIDFGGTDFGEVVDEDEEEMQSPHVEHVNQTLHKELPLKYVLNHLHEMKVAKQLYRDLFIFTPFVILFVFFSFVRRDTLQDHYTSSALSGVLSMYETPPQSYATGSAPEGPHYLKDFFGVDTAEDWYNWFERVAIPVFYDATQRDVPGAKAGPIGENLNVGPLRVRSHRIKDNSCDNVIKNFYPDGFSHPCWDDFTKDKMRKDPIGSNNEYNFTDGCGYTLQTVQGWYARYPCGGFEVDFHQNLTFNEALALAESLRNNEFIDEKSSRFLAIEFITYNPSLDVFTSGRIFHEITASGGWIPTARYKSFTVFSDKRFPDGMLALEFILFAFIIYYLIRFLVRWVRSIIKTGRCARFIFNGWNFLEICNIFIFIAQFGIHWEWWSTSIKDVSIKLPNINLGWQEPLNYLMEVYYFERYLTAINTVITFLMIIRYFQMNQRLNILTRTLEASAQSVFGVIIIFVLIVIAYALAGMILYGATVHEFRNMSSAFATLFLILVGNFDYETLRRENRGWTFIYFWSFVVLALFIMLNFITAIVGNGFDEEQSKTKNLPLEVQFRRMTANARRYSLKERIIALKDAFITRTRRLPEDVLEDYLGELRRSLLVADKISLDELEQGHAEEPDYFITRSAFTEVLPQDELERISENFLDALFLEIAEDFDLIALPEEEQEEERIVAAFETGMREGFLNVFVSKKAEIARGQFDLLGEGAETDADTLGAANSLKLSQSILRGSMYRRRSSQGLLDEMELDDEDSDEFNRSEAPPVLSDAELLDKLVGDAEEGNAETELRRKIVLDFISRTAAVSGIGRNGFANVTARLARLENTAENLNRFVNVTAAKVLKAAKKHGKKTKA